MDKKDALLRSMVELKSAHDKASKELADILTAAAKIMKGGDDLPTISQLRRYKKALAAAKLHASQSEMILVEYAVPNLSPDQTPPQYLQ